MSSVLVAVADERFAVEFAQQGLVDLHDVGRELLGVLQRGIAGAEVVALKLNRRHVNVGVDVVAVVAPGGHLAGGLFEDVLAEGDDHAVLLGDRDERFR